MSYIVTLEVPDEGFINPWYEIFERGCCAGCPNSGYDMEKNQTICWIMGMALPVGYDHDSYPWELCPINSVEHTGRKIPIEKGSQRWQRPE